MKQRILSLFLAAALVSGLLPATALAAEETPQSPQIIQTAEDLMALGGQELEGTYELAADIDMQDQPMEPIAGLTGVLDGKGHTISNLCLTGQAGTMWGGSVQTGLVGTLNGTICNLKLEQLPGDHDRKLQQSRNTGRFCTGRAQPDRKLRSHGRSDRQ